MLIMSAERPTAEATSCDIAIVVSSMEAGGAQRVALNLAEEFHERGFDVNLILVSEKGPLLKDVPEGVRLISLNSPRARDAIFKFRRYIRDKKPSAIISFTFHVNAFAALSMIGLRSKTRLIWTVHSTLSEALREWRLAVRSWLKFLTIALSGRANSAAAVSKGAAADFARNARFGADRIVTIHNPVLGRDFEARASRPPDHLWLKEKVAPVVLAVGRLVGAKDYPTLLRAFARVVRQVDARLIIYGEGDRRGELAALVEELGLADRVALPGFVENPLPSMKTADVFVLSSSREGFGNVLVEAMATGTPVVSTDCPHGPGEILEDGKWGTLVPVGDDEALAEAIVGTLRHGGIDARTRAREFTVKAAADKFLALVAKPINED